MSCRFFHFIMPLCLGIIHLACGNYNLLEKLEKPGGSDDMLGANRIAQCGMNCRMFVTQGLYSGNLSGLTGADAKCQNDAANPAGAGAGNWKAMVSGSTRTACTSNDCSSNGSAENLDWVLKPNTPYKRPDGTQIAATNASAIFAFPIANSIEAVGNNTWTGFYATWTRVDGGDNCNDWTNDGGNAIYALSGSATATAIANFHIACSNTYRIYCVEQ